MLVAQGLGFGVQVFKVSIFLDRGGGGAVGYRGLRDMGGSFRKLWVPYLGVLIIRILLCRLLYSGPLFSETPIYEPHPELNSCTCAA